MRLFVVEDEALHLEDLLISLKQLNYNCIGFSNDAFEAQETILQLKPDIVLMDIHLNGRKTGIALARIIKKQFNIPVIFTTSSTDIDIIKEAADVEPISYITKPIKDSDLNAALILTSKRIKNNLVENNKTLEEVFIKNGNKLVKVDIKNILFAHTDTKNYCSIITTNNKLSVRNSISGLKELLNHDTFIQTHRSYIVNWKKIDTIIESEQVIEINNHQIPLGRSFKESVYKRLQTL